MSITQIDKDTYVVRVTKKVNGKVIYDKKIRVQGTKGKAKSAERELFSQADNLANKRNQFSFTWQMALDEYLARIETVQTASTFLSAKTSLVSYTSQWNDLEVSQLDAKAVADGLRVKFTDQSPTTKQRVLRYVRGVFKLQVDEGKILINPANKVSFGQKPKFKKLSAMNRSEVKKLLNYLETRDTSWYQIFRITYELGLRAGEAQALTWGHINFETSTVTVNNSYCKVSKEIKGTKNGSGRTVPLNESLKKFLESLKSSSPDSQFVLPRKVLWLRGESAKVLREYQRHLELKRPIITLFELPSSLIF